MSQFRKVTINTLAQILGRVGVVLISLVVTAVITRSLGQKGYGTFGVISGAVMMFFSFADWGTLLIAVRELANYPGKKNLVLGNSLITRALMALVASAFFGLFVLVNPAFSQFRREILIAGVMIFFLSLKSSAQIIFHAEMRLYLTSLVEFVGSLIFLLGLAWGFDSLSLQRIVVFLVFSSVVSALVALAIALKETRPIFKLQKKFVKSLLTESLPMGAVLAVYSLYSRLGSFVLQYMHGEAAVGIYLLSFKVYDNLKLGAAYLMNAFFPVIASFPGTKNQPNKKLASIVQKAFDALLVMAALVWGVTFIFAPWIIKVLGGVQFLPSVRILKVLGLTVSFSYLNHLTGYSLVALKEQRKHFLFGLIGLLFNLVGNFLVIPRWSYLGVAWISVFTEILIFCLSFSFLRRRLSIKFSAGSILKTLNLLVKKTWQIVYN